MLGITERFLPKLTRTYFDQPYRKIKRHECFLQLIVWIRSLRLYRSTERNNKIHSRRETECGTWRFYTHTTSVANPGCLSRIPDPDFYPSRIPDPGSRIPDPGSKNSNKRERWKKICCHSHKFHKIVNYFSFEVLKKKIWANFQRIIELFTKKIVKKLLKRWSWDPGSEIRDPRSGIRDPEKTYSGSRIPGSKSTQSRISDPGSGSATLHTTIKRPFQERCHGQPPG